MIRDLKNAVKGGLCLLATVIATMSAASANAQGITLGLPGYGGNGCPANSASVTLSPDQTQLSILFDQYVVEAGNGRTFDRRSCNIAIPVHVPQGYSISVFQVDYRGFTNLPMGARAQFNVDYFFANSNAVRTTKNFWGGTNGLYEINDGLVATALVWSRCGEDTNLRVNSSMFVQSNRRGELAMATVDSADVTSGLIYHIQWKRCF